MRKINYSTSRVWTDKELIETIREARAEELIVEQKAGFTTIINPDNGDVILRSLPYTRGGNLVRIDQSYFYDEYKPVYVYVDENRYVTYMCDQDSEANKRSSWKLYVIRRKDVQLFMNYYELQFHPITKSIAKEKKLCASR